MNQILIPPKIKKRFQELTDKEDWKKILQGKKETFKLLLSCLSSEEQEKILMVGEKYSQGVTPYYASLIERVGDPLWIQCIHDPKALINDQLGLRKDYLDEYSGLYSPHRNLKHRYLTKCGLMAGNICPGYCTFCCRNYEVGIDEYVDLNVLPNIMRAIDYIEYYNNVIDGSKKSFENLSKWANDNGFTVSEEYLERHFINATEWIKRGGSCKIRDVLITGGDPLTLSDDYINSILNRLTNVKGVEVIRIGTRYLPWLPQRFTTELLSILKKYSRFPLYINTHFNHSKEITSYVKEVINSLLQIGIVVRNQHPLLKGVNDNIISLRDLCEDLTIARIVPYYSYVTMMVEGTTHLRVPLWKSIVLFNQLKGYTSGFAIPKLILSAPGGRGKIAVPEGLYSYDIFKGKAKVRNYENKLFDYFDPIDYPNPTEDELKQINSILPF
jgi:lysine 2,3-aminomutase